jgi:hypothetical protein
MVAPSRRSGMTRTTSVGPMKGADFERIRLRKEDRERMGGPDANAKSSGCEISRGWPGRTIGPAARPLRGASAAIRGI